MGFLDWFGSCTQKEREAARKLIAAGKRQAAKHPAMQSVAGHAQKDSYEYCYTVAFAVMGMLGANMYFPQDKRRGTTEAIKSELDKWRRGSYSNDGHHLMSTLNLAGGLSAEVAVGGWVIEQVALGAGDKAAPLRELKGDEGMMEALGKQIMTQSAESVVALFLEDKN